MLERTVFSGLDARDWKLGIRKDPNKYTTVHLIENKRGKLFRPSSFDLLDPRIYSIHKTAVVFGQFPEKKGQRDFYSIQKCTFLKKKRNTCFPELANGPDGEPFIAILGFSVLFVPSVVNPFWGHGKLGHQNYGGPNGGDTMRAPESNSTGKA